MEAANRIRPLLESDAEISISETESIIRCRTSANDEKLSDILAHLVSARDKVSQFREVAGDLEEAFVSAAREAEAERAGQTSAQTAAASQNPTEVTR
jgi:ABC-2 type transport system ATP-binding protein